MVNLFVVSLVLILCSLCYSNYTYGKVDSEAIQRGYSVNSLLDDQCLKCICETSTGCTADPCNTQRCQAIETGNYGCACGFFGITPSYWISANRPYLPGTYENESHKFINCVESKRCSIMTVQNNMGKNAKDCDQNKVIDCDDYVLIHVYGPGNCVNASLEKEKLIRYNTCMDREVQKTNETLIIQFHQNTQKKPTYGTSHYKQPPPLKEPQDCLSSETEVLGESKICKEELLFHNDINDLNWKRSHFIASEPDYVFCSYQKRNDTFLIKDDEWIIKPIPCKSESDVRGILDLRKGCTSDRDTDCIMYQDGGFILPPVTSERIKTTRGFKYGTVEIRAKLPVGDWLYPEIYLQSSLSPAKKIWVAYARGNEHLIGNGGDDLGGTLLFGGPILNVSEPERSKYLNSTRADKVFGSDYHTYSVIWKPKKISLLVDEVLYGESEENISSFFDEPMHLVLGIGVGGVTDFPDNYVSTNNKKKPWVNFERLQMKKFFNARDDWLPTWTDDGSCLKIKHVKIKAL